MNSFTKDEDLLFTRVTKIIQFFLKLLQVSVGDLNISKCASFTVFHRWKGGRAKLLRTHDYHPAMNVTHPSYRELEQIYRRNPNEAHRELC
jgi:hypothetical protein